MVCTTRADCKQPVQVVDAQDVRPHHLNDVETGKLLCLTNALDTPWRARTRIPRWRRGRGLVRERDRRGELDREEERCAASCMHRRLRDATVRRQHFCQDATFPDTSFMRWRGVARCLLYLFVRSFSYSGRFLIHIFLSRYGGRQRRYRISYIQLAKIRSGFPNMTLSMPALHCTSHFEVI